MKKNLNLKIYGATTVGPKGQIIIPKEIRDEFNINNGLEVGIAMVDKKAFGIGFNKECKNDIVKENKVFDDFGKINIGSKFQFVIPCIIRKELGIESGDTLIVIGKGNDGIGFIKNDSIEYLLEFIKNITV